MAAGALSRSGDFHDAQFLGRERSHDAAVSDGDVPEEYFHAGFGAFLRANRNGSAKPRFAWRALIQNYDVELSRSAFFV